MRVLVTGHLGFIGHHVVAELIRRNIHVVGVDRVYGISEKTERIALQREWAVTHEEADLSDFEQIDDVIRRQKPDAIAHMAAQYSVKYTTESMERYVRSNLVAPTYVFESAKVRNVKRVVYASSCAVSDEGKPSGLYGATKAYNEQMAHAYTERSPIVAVGLRYGPVYGPLSRNDAPVYVALNEYLHNMRLSKCGLFSRPMPYVTAKDAARVTVDCVTTIRLKDKHSVFPVAADDPLASIVDIVRAAQTVVGHEPRWPTGVALPQRTEKMPDIERLKAFLGYGPPTKLIDGVAETVNWMKRHAA